MMRRVPLFVCAMLIATSLPDVTAAETSYGEVRPILAKYCFSCHGNKAARAKLNLEQRRGSEPAEAWKEVLTRIQTSQMPPPNHPRPTVQESRKFVGWVEGMFSRHTWHGQRDPGPLQPRRLNVRQYMNSIRDLAVADPTPLPRDNPFAEEHQDESNKAKTAKAKFPLGIGIAKAGNKSSGIRYELHFSTIGGGYVALQHPCGFVESNLPADTNSGGFDTVDENLSIPPFLTEKYLRCTEVLFEEMGFDRPDAGKRIPADNWVLKKRIDSIKKLAADKREPAAVVLLDELASRAFRRPVAPGELQKHLALYKTGLEKGMSFESALWLPIQAILVSPKFVVLWGEPANPSAPGEGKGVRPLDDFELASRLSYFLWSSVPDRELTKAAEAGQLRDPQILEAQIRRMLKDERVREGLLKGFLFQWLQLAKLESAMPDPQVYAEFHRHSVGEFLRRELMIFTEAVLWDDRSIVDFIDADWTYLCDPLQSHYGLSAKKLNFNGRTDSVAWQKFKFADKRRGGVLTMGIVLTGTSKPTRTSPVNRGKWALENLLGIIPPPPPPEVDNELKDDKEPGKNPTVRQLLERHRSNASCASCHRLIDPLGLGLENFDPIGRWRDQDNGQLIDASGETIDGRKFGGVEEMRASIVARKDDFARCLTEKMLAYALGRRLEHYDIAAVREIVAAIGRDDYKLSRLVVEIATSYPFRHRRVKNDVE